MGYYSYAPARDVNGEITGAVMVLQDITERKKAEEQIRASEKRLRNTLDEMLEGCQIISPDWRYLYINDAAARQGRSEKEKLLGKTMMELYPGIEKTEAFSEFQRCMKERVPVVMVNEFTFPGGDKGWFELSIQPVPEALISLNAKKLRTR